MNYCASLCLFVAVKAILCYLEAHAGQKQFAGRVAIVTGGTRGIGRAIALELGRRGADVAFNYAKSAEAADSLKAELELSVCAACQCSAMWRTLRLRQRWSNR